MAERQSIGRCEVCLSAVCQIHGRTWGDGLVCYVCARKLGLNGLNQACAREPTEASVLSGMQVGCL